ncbi:putative HTH-type transcriptional regulator YdfH [Variovorax sp. SRS16]|uniref:GntR family transcriptional regulator n=1 Tax=Variovorax sp. SRS16 TaxID=282217 RepID=UPI00131670EB|nr:GntR family transcriptional regulator [Variovorax sp. SRS16]VTU14401.1 putative HTH-type transcriptional regulator YdfH [Variovorax sp. SRS16]
MTPEAIDKSEEFFKTWESAVAFRLFADSEQLTLTVPEQIALAVGDQIISGDLPPGSRIIEAELSAKFQVSRGPVRDAIRVLEREGLVTVLARRGAIVTELTADEIREIFEIRAGLLEIVARKVAERRDPGLLEMLKVGVGRLEYLANKPDDRGEYAETGYRLTIFSVRSCGNQRLARMLAGLSLQTLRYSKLGLASRERRLQSAAIWRRAVNALARGDTEKFVRLQRQRVEESGAEAVSILSTRPTAGRRAASPAPVA